MSSMWGNNIKISIFGQSHSAALGVVIDGLPAGFNIDLNALSAFMQRRAPGKSNLSTARCEPDKIEFVSGITKGVLCGAPLCALIKNTDIRPGDYSVFCDMPRPGHADFTAAVKFGGHQDATGGGHFSGRLTAALCVAGGICLQILRTRGIQIASHIERIANVSDDRFNPVSLCTSDFERLTPAPLTVINPAASAAMAKEINAARDAGDSVGGVIECAVIGLPAGIGNPIFDGLENKIASIVFGIPAVKGIEFGNGFESAGLHGSENNDPFVMDGDIVRTITNNHGGILGGISTGMPILFRAAIKPTPSISVPQDTISLSEHKTKSLRIRGRHDPCIVPRALPCIEAAAALAIYDLLLTN